MKKSEPPNKLQLQGSVTKLLTPNDLLTKRLFHLPAEKYARMIQAGRSDKIDEKITVKKKKLEVVTKYWVELVDGFTDMTPLDEFDRAVADACISIQDACYPGATLGGINRLLAGGKPHDTKLYPSRKEKILRSLERLMSTRIKVDFTALQATGVYPNLPKSGKLTSTILPYKILEGLTVNGQRGVDVFIFLDESPLLTLAQAKNQQLLSCPIGLLDVPNQNNTELVTRLKSYVLRRVLEIKAHKEMTPTITFADVFEKCGLVDATNSIKRNARKIIRDVFENLKTENVILEFDSKPEVDGRYRAIKFRY